MYIVYSGPGNRYASAAVSKRNGKNTSISYTYLGKVIDKAAGIYQSKERGLYTFDPATGKYGSVPDSYVPPEEKKSNRHVRISVDFGDVYFLNAFLWKSGLMEIVDRLDYGNPDTLHAMLLFYTLSGLANCDAIHWYEGSFAQLLYPKANLSSQRISDFLAAIGTVDRGLSYQQAYIQYVFQHYEPDRNILIDSSGLPNSIHMPYTCISNHNGKISNEVRLIFVVQKSTGLPLFYRAVPGNIVDVSTLERIFEHLDALGVDIESCIMDAGYHSGDNLDLFYDEKHQCKIGFITRVKSNDREFKAMVAEEFSGIDQKENFVKYEDRYLFIKKKQIWVGSERNNPAWLYLGLDCGRMADEQRSLLKRARKTKLTKDEVYDAMQSEGLFAVLSGREYSTEEILPAYYQRQSAEQIFDFAKNYTKLLPLRTNTEETFQGHLLLSYIACCAIKMIQLRLKSTGLSFGSRLACMRNQKCTIYTNKVVTDNAQKEANEAYRAFGIVCPASFPIVDGILQYTPPDSASERSAKKKNRRSKTGISKRVMAGTQPTAQDELKTEPRKRGRPKGSKNKKTLEREKAEQATPRKRDRPKGSKDKKTPDQETNSSSQQS